MSDSFDTSALIIACLVILAGLLTLAFS